MKENDIRILNWLTAVDYGLQQSQHQSLRQRGTCTWFSKTTEFRSWVSTQGTTLFCRGIPGAGKTIMTSMVIDDLESSYGNNPSIGIAYIYCNFQRQDQQTPDQLFAGLLKQLALGLSSLPEVVSSLYADHEKKRTRPTTREMFSALQKVVAQYSKVFIAVDALDEHGATPRLREAFLAQLSQLQQQYDINIFMTSRFDTRIDIEIDNNFKNLTELEIRADKEDIVIYVTDNLDTLPSAIVRNKRLRKDIIEKVSESVKGM
jgi:Cdc6-like AAA superfamily ATPase